VTGPPRACGSCGRRPIAHRHSRLCYDCQPAGPRTPPPCRRCGTSGDYYSAGLCGRCHQYAPQPPGACRDCHAWGVTRHTKWLCHGCASWRRTHPTVGVCRSCRRTLALDHTGVCRLCYRQTVLARRARRRHHPVDPVWANRHGQQLYLAHMLATDGQRHHPTSRSQQPAQPEPRPRQRLRHRWAAASPSARSLAYPVAHRQLLLFELPPDLSRVGRGGFPDPPDPWLAAWLEQLTWDHATRHGWSPGRRKTVRQAIRILLALQPTPGAPIRASEVARMTTIGLPVRPVLAILEEAGMLDDDRTPAIQRWFDRQVAELPAAMASELGVWFEVLLHGSHTPPRTRPRAEVTIRTQLSWAAPRLQAWAEAGHQSLREISRDDVLAALPAGGNPRATLGRALRSVFKVLKARKITFTNPTIRIKTGEPASRQPLPADLSVVREGLDSQDPARAALTALLAFHGLRSGQLCALRLTDLRDGRLHLGDHTILLAAPVRQRLAAWLDYRSKCWPNTANPHLFIHYRTATQTRPVGIHWLYLKLGSSVRVIREDRILNEAHANAGDLRRLCDLFGLSVKAASRYTATLDHPSLGDLDQCQDPYPDSGSAGSPARRGKG
jgi:integrase